MENRRQGKRFLKRCEVKFRSSDRAYRGISTNFSLNGLFIKTDHPFVKNTSLDIIVCLPTGLTSHVKGKVVRACQPVQRNIRNSPQTPAAKVMRSPLSMSKYGMGVSIIKKDPHYLHLIRSLVAERTPCSARGKSDAELDGWIRKRLEGKEPQSAPGEFEAFADEMQRKLSKGKQAGLEEADLQKLFEMSYDTLTGRQQQITDTLMSP